MDSAYKMCGMTAEAGLPEACGRRPPSSFPRPSPHSRTLPSSFPHLPKSSFPTFLIGNPGCCGLGFFGARHAGDGFRDGTASCPCAVVARNDGEDGGGWSDTLAVIRLIARTMPRLRLIASHAIKSLSEPLFPLCMRRHPRTDAPGGIVPHMLTMPAREICDPIPMFITVKPDDALLHVNEAVPCDVSHPANRAVGRRAH